MSKFLDPDCITAYRAQPPMNSTDNENLVHSNYPTLTTLSGWNHQKPFSPSSTPNTTLVLQNTYIVSNEHRLIKNECDRDFFSHQNHIMQLQTPVFLEVPIHLHWHTKAPFILRH